MAINKTIRFEHKFASMALTHPNATERGIALLRLREQYQFNGNKFLTRSPLNATIMALDDEDWGVRYQAAVSLGDYAEPWCEDAMLAQFYSESFVRTQMYLSLAISKVRMKRFMSQPDALQKLFLLGSMMNGAWV